jgi:hypothetical protein
MPRYLWNRCCTDPALISNSESENFEKDMGNSIRELKVHLRNMVFMRKLKGVSVLNTVEAVGIASSVNSDGLDLDRILALWGSDPVHPIAAAYRLLAYKITDMVEMVLREASISVAQTGNASTKRKAAHWEL